MFTFVSCKCSDEEPEFQTGAAIPLAPYKERGPGCPARKKASYPIRDVDEKMLDADYWLELSGPKADEILLSAEEVRAQSQARHGDASEQPNIVDLSRVPSKQEVITTLRSRFGFMRANMQSGEYRDCDQSLIAKVSQDPEDFALTRELRVALQEIPIRCGPFLNALTSTRGDPRFDRNSCSIARAQEPVEILGRLEGSLRLVRTAYTIGFVADDAPLSPPVPKKLEAVVRNGHKIYLTETVTANLEGKSLTLEWGTRLPRDAENSEKGYLIGTRDGFKWLPPVLQKGTYRTTPHQLTRGSFIREAFRYLNTPYGWGGQNGGRDCSRFIFDVMRSFGLELPRTSGGQARLGTYSVLVAPNASLSEREELLDTAHERGIVLIHFPGHIMIYLGRDDKGIPRALHSFAEYLTPCAEGGETLFEVDRVTVSGLDLGAGSSRGSFLERMTHMVVFGKSPGFELVSHAQFRHSNPPPAQKPERCFDTLDKAIFFSPRRPTIANPLRVIAVSQKDHRPARLWLLDPNDKIVAPEVVHLGVGPFAQVVTVKQPVSGRWMALLSDGDHTLACQRFFVSPHGNTITAEEADTDGERPEDTPAWPSRWKWEMDTENLYAAFVEHLFTTPYNEMRTWKSLQRLLADPERNILHNHLGLDEENVVELIPDCADLPYFLRAYFSWKLTLPFGYRRCNRGRPGRPPSCGSLVTNEHPVTPLTESEALEKPFTELEAVAYFIMRYVRSGVHASNGSTHPNDENADLYPIPLTRKALSPGTVFVDPYGHVIVVAKWVPSTGDNSAILVGADAQPDGTVGLRRFWRGSFLFSPETDSFGAGFKAFRPLVYDKETESIIAMDFTEMKKSGHFRPQSTEQYEGTADDFYHKMDMLISPQTVNPMDRLSQLVDALEEQVLRRLVSVQTGETFMKNRTYPIDMPEGYEIFETKGHWENYASPARDMRLLIAIDTVRRIGQDIESYPEFFGLEKKEAAKVARDTQLALTKELRSRQFGYTRTDGSEFHLTLADILARSEELEVAYNPNDCIEIRWGAPLGSEEMSTCQRRAPIEQRDRMETYRPWFRNRKRPPRTPK